jgi:hypothetical protein
VASVHDVACHTSSRIMSRHSVGSPACDQHVVTEFVASSRTDGEQPLSDMPERILARTVRAMTVLHFVDAWT